MNTTQNISFKSPNLSAHYSVFRSSWEELYPSEKKVIETLNLNRNSTVIDMGCACGGLGNALKEHFGITAYTGVDINQSCIERGKELYSWADLHSGDFLDIAPSLMRNFDVGFSLGCADWNVKTAELLNALMSTVRVGGSIVSSFRVVNEEGTTGVYEGKQRVSFADTSEALKNPEEYAPYKIYQLESLLGLLGEIPGVGEVYGYGYWGKPSPTAIDVPFERIFFLVVSLHKSDRNIANHKSFRLKLEVDSDLLVRSRKY